jgi:hypothetical protein
MHRRVLLVLTLMGLGAGPASAQRDQEMIRTISVSELKELMLSMNLKPRDLVRSDNEGLFFESHTLPAIIYIKDEGRTLEIMGLLEGVEPSDERVNAFNQAKRFGRAYVMEGALYLQQDVDLQKGVTRANVRGQIELFQVLAGNLVEEFK